MKKNFNPNSRIGETHGIYVIVGVSNEQTKRGDTLYKVRCQECGYEKCVCYGDVTGNKTINTCMHLIRKKLSDAEPTKWNNHRIGHIFNSMKRRCYNENDKNYKWYGAKGIKICDEWLNNPKLFEEWSLQNGYTDELTIDRIDEDKDYSPDNCRWITHIENAKYKSTTSMIEVNGEVHTGKDWSKILGLGANRINTYIRQYGLDNTIEFIRKYLKNPNLKPINNNCSIYSVYMN